MPNLQVAHFERHLTHPRTCTMSLQKCERQEERRLAGLVINWIAAAAAAEKAPPGEFMINRLVHIADGDSIVTVELP